MIKKCDHCLTTATVTTSCRCGRIKAANLDHFDSLANEVINNGSREAYESLFGFETGVDYGDMARNDPETTE